MTKLLAWDEHIETFDVVVNQLRECIEEKRLKIDAIVPILRGAGFLGTYLAYQLSVLRILPVQYKYLFPKNNAVELRKLLFTPSRKNLGDKPVLVLVEEDYCYGNASIEAAKDLRAEFPGCTIIFAADQADYTYKDIISDYVDYVVMGRYTNHCEELSEEECKKLEIQPLTRAAWELAGEEEAILKSEQWQYADLDKVESDSEIKFVVDFDELKSRTTGINKDLE